MRPPRRRTGLLAPFTLLLLLGPVACHDGEPAAPETRRSHSRVLGSHGNAPGAATLRVMTRNVYLGGNTGLVFGADFTDPLAVVTAAATVWAQVQASDIPARAAAVVDEIEASRPHVVSLQEVFRFASSSGLVLDWMDELEAEIVRRGLPYRTLAVQEATSATLPVSPGELVSFTDRIAVLVHEDLAVDAVAQDTYAAELLLASAPPPIGDVVIRRGWIRLAATFRGAPHHVVATHLETQGIRPVHDAQAQELIGSVAAGLDGATIVAGDLNSDAEAQEGDPSWTPTYGALVAAGFADAWLHTPPGLRGPGVTCCQAADLRNGPSLLDERVDFVLVRLADRPGNGIPLAGRVRTEVVGEEQGDRLASGLWPSDHAGLVAGIRLPPGLTTANHVP